MSVNGETSSVSGFDSSDHQPAYIFTLSTVEDAPERPTKRRRTGRASTPDIQLRPVVKFEPLLNGHENAECVTLREELFQRCWAGTEERIQSILGRANEDTLAKVSSFLQEGQLAEGTSRIPTGFIATGPNIASQSLLFQQLSERLRTEINGPVVILRSGDASNLKAALKQVIRDATHQRHSNEDDTIYYEQGGRKLLNYDLEILHGYVNTHGCHKAVIAFQDSEGFDPSLLADIIILFKSWVDRIPFVLLFGIATSVELFNERLSRAASRYLYGAQFHVEQTESVLESVFQQVIAGTESPLRLGPVFVSNVIERQQDHVQSVQAFTAALKYAYMCHFYANPLAILSDNIQSSRKAIQLLQPEHLEALRMLPSFQNLVATLLDKQDGTHARGLLENEEVLMNEVEKALDSRGSEQVKLIRKMSVLTTAMVEPNGKIELYLKAMKGTLNDSETVRSVLDAVKRMSPNFLLAFLNRIEEAIENGNPDFDLEGWADEESEFLEEVAEIETKVSNLAEEAEHTGQPIRSSYTTHSKGMRTTVIAQKVHLSFEQSTLSEQDLEYTTLVDKLLEVLKKYFNFGNPRDMFLSEVWLYDSTFPYKDVFTPRPRHSIERALSSPQDYMLSCEAKENLLSSSDPSTAILYQLYLESGSFVNIADLWTAFASMVSGEEGDAEGTDERTALMLFYRGLADLKLLGMIKQSKKKVDHLGKSAWNGL